MLETVRLESFKEVTARGKPRHVNATTFPYTYGSTVYSGPPVGEPGPYYVTGLEDTVKELLKMMMGHNSLQGRNVTMARLYTSVPLAGIPPELKSITGRKDNSYEAMFEDANQKMSLPDMCTDPIIITWIRISWIWI